MSDNLTDNIEICRLFNHFIDAFGNISKNDKQTIIFYYRLGIVRCVNAFEYISEAINRASMKKDLKKPISYIASLCKNFYRNGIYSQPSQEEKDIIYYIENKIGKLNEDNKSLLRCAISSSGSTRTMAAASEILKGAELQDSIIESILLRIVEIWED